MKILVLGSGILGVCTAYELGKRGYDVTVVDRNEQSARETSHSNGGQLSYSHAEPWANASALSKIAKWTFKSDAPLVLRPRADLDMITWGLKFLRNCTTSRAELNCINMLRLGMYSKERLNAIREEAGICFDHGTTGILHIFSNQEEYFHAREQNEFQSKFGCEQKTLTTDQVMALEPVLKQTQRPIVGGMLSEMDETGDPFLFCKELSRVATKKYGVTFIYDTHVREIQSSGDRISGITTDTGMLTADAYVVAMGSYSTHLLRQININVPIYPMKGYSITIKADENCPNTSLTDGTHKIVYSRLGDRLRVAGTAEFAGYSQELNPKRIAPIMKAAKVLLPNADWDHPILEWACIRPSTPDGPPILGITPFSNLYLNTGHGTLGWTQGAGSATIVADIIEKKKPAIMLHGLTLDRYM